MNLESIYRGTMSIINDIKTNHPQFSGVYLSGNPLLKKGAKIRLMAVTIAQSDPRMLP
jgi:hypothetical protein